MAKLEVNELMPDFRVLTVGGVTTVSALEDGKKTAFLFLRYAGCRVCRYDMMQLAQAYEKIARTGGQVCVILQSAPETIAAMQAEAHYPFVILSDEPGELYRALEIGSAESKETLGSPESRAKVEAAAACGIVHGSYEGNELQYPAAFVTDGRRRVLYARYGAHSGDTPSPDELAALLT